MEGEDGARCAGRSYEGPRRVVLGRSFMSSFGVVRWGGLAAVLAGVVFLVDEVIILMSPVPFLDVVFIVAMLLVLAGLVGFHALQKDYYGRVGRAGFYTIVAGIVSQVLGLLVLLSGSASLLWLISLATLAVLVGFVLYGAATLQAGVLPRWCGVALVVVFPVGLLLGVYAYLWFGLVWLALGYALWSRRGAATGQAARVS